MEKIVKTLFTLRSKRFERFTTASVEWECLSSELRGTPDPAYIDDVGSGYKVLARSCRLKYPNAKVRTLDIDATTEPDYVCDFLRPKSYCKLRRPELVITR